MASATYLVRLLLAHQRRVESATAEDPPPLSLLESHVLAEVAGKKICTFLDLATLGIERTKLSRLAKVLAKRGEISLQSSADDKRSLLIKLTPHGREALLRNDAHLARVIERATNPLSDDERSVLAEHLEELANGLTLPTHQGTKDPLLRALRRLSRGAGMVGGQFAESAISAVAFQILLLLETFAKPLRKMSLKNYLPLPASSLSRALTTLAQQRLLLVIKDSSDERAELIALATPGRKLVNDTLETLSRSLERATSHLGEKTTRELEQLLSKYAVDAHRTLADPGDLSILTSEEQRSRARGFVAEVLVRLGRAQELPAKLFSHDSWGVLVSRKNQIAGCLECSPEEPHKITFSLFDPDLISPSESLALQEEALRHVLHINKKVERHLKLRSRM
jgi:DNA-binding MarR family transcriptional regulator